MVWSSKAPQSSGQPAPPPSREKARRLFHNEPGVMRFLGPQNNAREYNTYRIPESVARRVRLRLMNI
jgi:hypothetical protein